MAIVIKNAGPCAGWADVIEICGDVGGSAWTFTVHYDRRGNVTHGYRHHPMESYLRPGEIPAEVAKAAHEAWRSAAVK